jgi:hypothetical protein
MIAQLHWHDHQRAERDDFWIADGITSVEVIVAFF